MTTQQEQVVRKLRNEINKPELSNLVNLRLDDVSDILGETQSALEQANSNQHQREVQLHKALDDLKTERELREQAQRERDEAHAIVDRVWKALGITTYEQAKPFAIDEHVTNLLTQRNELQAKCAKLEACCGTHSGDCTIYASLINRSPTDGICTCGYGWRLVQSNADYSQMLSKERLEAFKESK